MRRGNVRPALDTVGAVRLDDGFELGVGQCVGVATSERFDFP
jgi:hypothetical protein